MDAEMVFLSLKMGLENQKYVSDLKLVVLRNKTNIDFVISDNPLVFTNRFHFQRLNTSNFGLASSGTILAMPLGPQLCAARAALLPRVRRNLSRCCSWPT